MNYGDTVEFGIAINAKAYVGDKLATYYYITDTLADGFDAVEEDDIVVTVYPVTAAGIYSTTGIEVDYDVSMDDNTFTITVPFGETFGSEARIVVTYSATIKADGEDVVLGSDGNLNTANFTYTAVTIDPDDPGFDPNPANEDPNYPEPDDDPEYPDNPAETKTYVYEIDVLKVDGEADTSLSGAHFTLADGTNAIPLAYDDTAKFYYYKADGDVTDLVTGEDGKILIKGLEDGTYTLTETTAPSGYNLPSDPDTEVTVGGEYHADWQGDNAVKILNNKGTELPATGGIGTTLFITFGSLAMLAAGVFLVTNKRMKKEDLAF